MQEILECKTHGATPHRREKRKGKIDYLRCCKCACAAVTKRRALLKAIAIEYKGGGCQHCGYSKCSAALEFHHTDPMQKDFGIAENGHTMSEAKMKSELDKCVMLCANCHREEHVRLKLEV